MLVGTRCFVVVRSHFEKAFNFTVIIKRYAVFKCFAFGKNKPVNIGVFFRIFNGLSYTAFLREKRWFSSGITRKSTPPLFKTRLYSSGAKGENTLSTASQEKSAVGKANTLATAKRIFLLCFAAAIRANFEISIPAILAFLSARAFSIFPV